MEQSDRKREHTPDNTDSDKAECPTDGEGVWVCLKGGQYDHASRKPFGPCNRCNVVACKSTTCIDTSHPPLPYCPKNPLLFRSNGALQCGTLRRFEAIGLDWRKVLKELPTTFLPWDLSYDLVRLLADRLFSFFPNMIVFCRDPEDVRRVISLSKRFDLRLSIRAGGHLREYYSVQHPIILDVTPMHEIKLLKKRCRKDGHRSGASKERAVRVGSGTRIGPVYDVLADKGLVFASGTCPPVGCSGLFTGGGIGFAMRKYGLLVDQILSARIVLADESVHEVSATKNPDLFFALRGKAGGNYGVLTEMTFRVHPLEGGLSIFLIEWPIESAVDLIDVFQRWGPEIDRGLTAQFNCTPKVASVEGALIGGGPDRLLELLIPLFAVPGAKIVFAREATLREYYSAFTGNMSLEVDPFFVNSNFFIDRILTREEIEVFVEQIRLGAEVPGTHSFGLWAMLGAVADVPPDATAFFWRGSRLWFLQRNGFRMQQDQEAVVAYSRQFFAAVRSVSKGIYVNFPNPDLGQDEYPQEYWGGNVERLRMVKAVVDPENVFCFAQSIVPCRDTGV